MSLKSRIEAIIYAAEEPVTLDQIAAVLREEVLAAIASAALPTAQAQQTELVASADTLSDELLSDAPPAIGDDATRPATGGASEQPETGNGQLDSAAADEKRERAAIREHLRKTISALIAEYEHADRGMEVRQVAGGYRMSTKPEHHDVVRGFVKSMKPPMKLSLPALETLAVIAYKQPVTVPEINEIRGVDASGVIAGLISRKLITTSGRKQVIGRPMLYKTSKEFLLRFGLKDLNELPSIEEFEKLVAQEEMFEAVGEQGEPENHFGGRMVNQQGAVADATGVSDADHG